MKWDAPMAAGALALSGLVLLIMVRRGFRGIK